jgi:predicted DNA repair protein MutK
MPSGLVALLDDIAGLTQLTAASLDDVHLVAGKAAAKAAGVVIDDTAVTPRYVTGLTPDRELPIIGRIAAGSLRNKLLILLPAALLLSAVAPWAITPLLMLGGAFLCFEGAEKAIEAVCDQHDAEEKLVATDAATLERQQVSGAIRTDLILSAEIMAIALGEVAAKPLLTQAAVLILVGIALTAGVYGVVALIVKMDDIGLHLARRTFSSTRALGRALVKAMPIVMNWLSVIGTAAMIWVGGGILAHGLDKFGIHLPEAIIHHFAEAASHAVPIAGAAAGWAVKAFGSGLLGLAVGGFVVAIVHLVARLRGKAPH